MGIEESKISKSQTRFEKIAFHSLQLSNQITRLFNTHTNQYVPRPRCFLVICHIFTVNLTILRCMFLSEFEHLWQKRWKFSKKLCVGKMSKLNSGTQNRHNFIQANFRRLPKKPWIPYFQEETRHRNLRNSLFLAEDRSKKIFWNFGKLW